MTSLDGLLHNSQVVNTVLRGVTTAEATYFEHFGFTNQLRRDGSRKGLSNKILQTRYRYIYFFLPRSSLIAKEVCLTGCFVS